MIESNITVMEVTKTDPYITKFTYRLGDSVTMHDGFYTGTINARADHGHWHCYRLLGFTTEGSMFDEWVAEAQIDKPKPVKRK